MRSLRIVCSLAELNGLKLTDGDVGNAYLEACTTEKVCVRAGPEFGPLEGHLLVIEKVLYGLRTSGARFHAKFADALRAMGFTPTYADLNVWIREAVAGGWVRFEHIPGTENPADILTKPSPWFSLKVFVEPLLLWKGDTVEQIGRAHV